jgi:hypothetical protein
MLINADKNRKRESFSKCDAGQLEKFAKRRKRESSWFVKARLWIAFFLGKN